MRRFLIPIAITLAILTVMLAVPVHAQTTNQINLSSGGWHDSGYDLAAGYRYSIGLKSGHIWTGAEPKAIFSAGPIYIQLQGQHLQVKINDNVAFDQDIGSYDTTVYITVQCDGSGTVEVAGQGTVGGFSIDHSYRIMVYTETVHTWPSTATSQVQISRQSLHCQVTNPSLTPLDEPQHLDSIDLGHAATVAATVIFLGFGIIILLLILGKAGGAKKLAKRALG